MRLENTEGIIPQQDLVVVDIQPSDTKELYLGSNEAPTIERIEMYYGIVESIGPLVEDSLHCPGLKVNDTAIFSQFAGSHIATNNGKMHKIIRGYDIMATTTDMDNITEETVNPTADRVLVTGLKQDVTEDGLFIDEESSRDPRLTDIRYGYVVKTGPSVKTHLRWGTVVAYDLHVGETIRDQTSDALPELRVIREDDILFIRS